MPKEHEPLPRNRLSIAQALPVIALISFGGVQLPDNLNLNKIDNENNGNAIETIVFLENFPDNPVEPYSLDEVKDAFEGDMLDQLGNPSVASYYEQATFGKLDFNFTYVDWYSDGISQPADCDSILGAAEMNAQQSAQANNIDIENYPLRIFMVPEGEDCGYLGKATTIDGYGEALIYGTLNGHLSNRTIIHEIGHTNIAGNLGHAASIECKLPDNYTDQCTIRDKGGSFDPMGGNSKSGEFNAVHLIQMGVIPESEVLDVSTSGQYVISALEKDTAETRVIRIKKSDTTTNGVQDYYYLELRRPIGLDAAVIKEEPERVGILINIWNGVADNNNITKEVNEFQKGQEFRVPLYLSESNGFDDVVNGIHIKVLKSSMEEEIIQIDFDDKGSIQPNEFVPEIIYT